MKKKTIFITAVCTAALIAAVGAVFLLRSCPQEKPVIPEAHSTAPAVTAAQTDQPATTEGAVESNSEDVDERQEVKPPVLVESPKTFDDYASLNDEIYSWISIPDTNIEYPVAQSRYDDNFYLNHDAYKNYSFPGTIYSQSHNSLTYQDRVTVLYGHNMLDGSMFATLHYFRDRSFFDDHPYFYIYTKKSKLTYMVVTAFDYDDRHIMNSFDFKNDAVFSDWIEQAKNPRSTSANVRNDVPLDLNSKFVVLSTCQNYGSGRYLVQGVLIKDEWTE